MSEDLEAKLALARDDVRRLKDAYKLAWDLDLGYGVTAQTYEPRVSASATESPVLSYGELPELAHKVELSLRHLARAHHWYGELGQTVWPTEPLGPLGGDGGVLCVNRVVTLEEAQAGAFTLDVCLAELQRTQSSFVSVQETAYALATAHHASLALSVLPGELWRGKPHEVRTCEGVPGYRCGQVVKDRGRRCWACRQRLSRMKATT